MTAAARPDGDGCALVLVVDDDPLVRAYLSEVLSGAGYAAQSVATAREALAMVSQQSPAAILTDLVMPEQDGIELIRELRNRGVHAPIVAMSGGGQIPPDVYLEMAGRLGATTSLQKPFSNAELLRVLREQILRV